MADTPESDSAAEHISQYEAEYSLLQAELTQQMEHITDLSGERLEAALRTAMKTLDEMSAQLNQIQVEKQRLPSDARAPVTRKFRDHSSEVDGYRRKLRSLGESGDPLFDQRQQLLAGTDRLDRSTQRLKASEVLAAHSEDTGARTLAELQRQRETIDHGTKVLQDSDTYLDRSIKTLKGMARWLPF